jgi:hypothetical protein
MGSGLDQEFLEDFAGRWWEAWNLHDGAAVAELCTEAKAIVPWRFEATHKGELAPMGLAPTGARVMRALAPRADSA